MFLSKISHLFTLLSSSLFKAYTVVLLCTWRILSFFVRSHVPVILTLFHRCPKLLAASVRVNVAPVIIDNPWDSLHVCATIWKPDVPALEQFYASCASGVSEKVRVKIVEAAETSKKRRVDLVTRWCDGGRRRKNPSDEGNRDKSPGSSNLKARAWAPYLYLPNNGLRLLTVWLAIPARDNRHEKSASPNSPGESSSAPAQQMHRSFRFAQAQFQGPSSAIVYCAQDFQRCIVYVISGDLTFQEWLFN